MPSRQIRKASFQIPYRELKSRSLPLTAAGANVNNKRTCSVGAPCGKAANGWLRIGAVPLGTLMLAQCSIRCGRSAAIAMVEPVRDKLRRST